MRGDGTDVSEKTEARVAVRKNELARLACVMRHGGGMHLDIADGKAFVRIDQADVGVRVELALEGGESSRGHPHRHAEAARATGDAAAMIAVFVGDEDGAELVGAAVMAFEAQRGFARRESAVEHQQGATAFDQRGIAAAAAAENAEPQPGALSLCPFARFPQSLPTFE